MVELKFALIAIIWFPAMKLTSGFGRHQKPNVCHGESSEWSIIAQNKTLLQCNDLLKSFHDSMPADLSHWYLSAWADEYASDAWTHIAIADSTNSRMLLRNVGEGDLSTWEELHKCDRILIRFQQIFNTLAARLQCVSSTALIVMPSIYLGVMPPTDTFACSAFRSYIGEYNSKILKYSAYDYVEGQAGCANRMLNNDEQSAWNEAESLALNDIKELLIGLSVADEETTKNIVETVANNAKGLFGQYLRERHLDGEHQWTDCHVIANDLEACLKSESPQDRKFRRFRTLETCVEYVSRSTFWYRDIKINFENILRMATVPYYKASKKLVKQFKTKLDKIKTMPIFTSAALGLLATVFTEFASKILQWRDAMKTYRPANRADFLTQCDALRTHFATISVTAKRTEDQLRALFRENAVYVPIISPSRTKFNINDAGRLIAEYTAAFNAQFNNKTPLHTESRLKAQEAIAKSLFKKKFSAKKVYLQNYSEFLADCVLALDFGAWKLDATQNSSSYFSKLRQFVAALNEYGNDSFNLIHPELSIN